MSTHPRLDLIGHGKLSKFFVRFRDNRESMVVGRYIAKAMSGKRPYLQAVIDALETFNKSESEIKRDYGYYKSVTKWVFEVGKSGRLYRAMTQEKLENVYHMAQAQRKKLLSGTDCDIQRVALRSDINVQIVPRLGAKWADVFMLLCSLPLDD